MNVDRGGSAPRRCGHGLIKRLTVTFSMVLGWLLCAHAVQANPSTVGLYRSPHTLNYFQSVGANYEALVSPWRQTLGQLGFLSKELRSENELQSFNGGVLVIPSAVALSERERNLLKQFKANGGSLLVTWALGVRDAEGRWLGHGFTRELLGVTVTTELPADTDLRFVIPFGDIPLNQVVRAGQRVWLPESKDRPLQLSGGQTAALYMTWLREVLSRAPPPSAVNYGEDVPISAAKPGGRWVLFGFNESHWGSQRDLFDDLNLGALQWLQRAVPPYLTAWPNGRRAAQIIEMDTEDGFGNAVHFAELMEQMGVKATFYCLTSEARKHAKLVQDLAKHHEVSFHGEVHYGFERMPREVQQKRLLRMLDEMRLILGSDPSGWPKGAGRGFRAPTESYDQLTEELLLELGFQHHTADPNRVDHRLPLFNRAGTKSPSPSAGLVVLPRSQPDDLNYRAMKLTPAQVGEALIGEYETNLKMAGMGLLSVHTQNFIDPKQINLKPQHSSLMTEALEVLVKHVGRQHDRVWIASAAEVTQWWRARANVLIEQERTRYGWALKLTVTGSEAVDGLSIMLPLTAVDRTPRWRWSTNTQTTGHVLKSDALSHTLVLGKLAPGQHTLLITGL